MLIDWDLSKEIKDDDDTPRQHSRTVRFTFFWHASAPLAHGICVQGTWQFISISRLNDPSTRPHQVSDDLESFFWVLLYLVVKCRNSTRKNLSGNMKDVFDQHSDVDHNGNVTGGDGKQLFLDNKRFDSAMIRTLVNTPCRKVIEKLRSLLRNNYFAEGEGEDDSDSDDLVLETKRQEATEKLSSSKWILEMINKHLSSKWDVGDDGSLHKTVLRPDSAASRNRRKRKAEDNNEEKLTFGQRRKGRLPPRSTVPSRDTVWSQGTHSHSNSRSGTLLGSSSRGATHVSTRSQSLRSYSRGSKAMPIG